MMGYTGNDYDGGHSTMRQLAVPAKNIWSATPMSSLLVIMALITAVSVSLAWESIQNNYVGAVAGVGDGKPVGTSLKGYWTTAPDGYLLEDGSAVSRTTYANLFSVIGTTFGAGDGSTTFNLPDSRGLTTVARSPSESEFASLGQSGGEKTHTLTTTEMPAHDHDYAGYTISWGVSVGTVWFRESDNDANKIIAIGGAAAVTNGMYVNNGVNGWVDTYHSGGGAAHNNLQPYLVVTRAIKY